MKLSKISILIVKLTIIFVFTLILTIVVVSYSSEHHKRPVINPTASTGYFC